MIGRILHVACRYSSSVAVDLKNILVRPNAVLDSAVVLEQHAHDESYHRAELPAAVVFPVTVSEVSAIAAYCNRHKIALIPFGTGTGLEGGVVPAAANSVTINMSKMDKVLSVNDADFDCTVESGVSRVALNNELESSGLWFPIDPGADASLCGMCATGASGTNAVRYGTMKENVLNLEVVLADGRVVQTNGPGKRCRKTSAGYNLTQLLVGSEGTLGIITKATLRLHPRPEELAAAISHFSSVDAAVQSAVQLAQSGLSMAKMEYLNGPQIAASNRYSHLTLAEQPSLFLEFQGTKSSIADQVAIAKEICLSNGGSQFVWAIEQEKRNHLWKARHMCWYAMKALRPGTLGVSTDACVPITHLPEIITFAERYMEKHGIAGTIVGHVGDGNFHCFIALDTTNDKECATVSEFKHQLSVKALQLNGTTTGEHGIGLGKLKTLRQELGDGAYEVMRNIKTLFDPNNILNPHKKFFRDI